MSDKKEKKDFIDSTFRKKWDREFYEQKARDREAGLIVDDVVQPTKKQIVAPSVESLGELEARTEDFNFMQRLGKVTVVNGVTPTSAQGGLYCEKCDIVLKDSVSMLDHYNSKKHLRMEGKSMRVTKSSLSQVQEKMRLAKQEKEKKKALTSDGMKKKRDEDYQTILQKVEEKEREDKREQKVLQRDTQKDTKSDKESTLNKIQDNGNGKSNTKQDTEGESTKEKHENKVAEVKEKKIEKNVEKVEEVEEEEEEDEEEAQLRAMGLPTSFGSSKKNK